MRLAWQGEPLLHPQMEEILQWLADAWQTKPFARRIEIPTNGTLLNHNYCRITTAAGAVPFAWVVEIDAWDWDSYLLHHKEELWNRVLDNVNFLLQEVEAQKPAQMAVVLQCTVTEATADGVTKFVEFWREQLGSYGLEASLASQGVPTSPGVHLHFRRPDPPDLEGIRAARAQYNVALESLGIDPSAGAPDDNERRVCAAYWKTPTVSWDGKVMLCTTDVQQTMKVGEATLDSLSESWWNGQRLHQIRKQAAREDFSGLNLCRGCNQPYSPNAAVIDKDEIDRYMAAVT
jgi:MoaA/NifB/PqqE/SkfB family radical SAM enzyme